jgi:hypothetical protein
MLDQRDFVLCSATFGDETSVNVHHAHNSFFL